MLWNLPLAVGLLAAETAASGILALERGAIHLDSHDVLSKRYVDVASGHLVRRQRPQYESTLTLNPDGSVDMEAWDEETEAACQDSLKRLRIASNPSGVCICYNLPSLDTTSGVFDADLRVYRLNEPGGAFLGISPEDIKVALAYDGATVDTKADTSSSTRKRQDSGAARAQVDAEVAATPDLPLLQHYSLVGQIEANRMADEMTMAELEALVMPVLTLTAVNANGQTVATNVSSNEAVFVTGIFSRVVVMSDFALASAAVDEAVEQLANRTVAFVLPGIQIMVYPIGAIITGTWLVLGMVAYGIGTYDRVRFAEHYRRRVARANDTAGKRI